MPTKRDYETKECAVYNILGLWIQDSENKHTWIQCIVHLIRNSLKYVPTRDYKDFTAHLKKIYGEVSIKACHVEFERFCQVWAKYLGAIAVWKRCFAYVKQLFDYPSAVRKIMYTTNAVEAVNSNFHLIAIPPLAYTDVSQYNY